MYATRRVSITTAVLLLVATIAAVAAAGLHPALSGRDYLAGVADHPRQMAAAALLYLIAAATSVGIAIVLYPLLRKFSSAQALGSVVFRTIEAVMYAAGVVCLLSVLTLGQEYAAAPVADRAPIQAMADTLLSLRDHSSLVAVFAFGVGALMYYAVFYRSRLIPRWLSGFGLGATAAMLVACLLALFSNSDVTGYTLLAAPIFVQELVLAVWLLARGFSPTPLLPRTSPAVAPTGTPVGTKARD